jgi:CHAT domain-containing protein/tetratricopeptide (TPR) repeat protein
MNRLAAFLLLAMAGVIQAPDRGAASVEAMVLDAENLAYFEAFVPARAKLEAALRTARRLGDPRLTAICLDRLGSVLDFEGQIGAGGERHRSALEIARGMDDQATVASVLASIGHEHWRQSEYDAALDVLRQAEAIQDAIGDRSNLARTLVFIGRVHFKRAEYSTAKSYHLRALALLTSRADRRWASIALEDLGDVALEQGFFAEALDAFERSLDVRRELGDSGGEVYMLNVIGRVYLQQQAYREALGWHARALARSDEGDTLPSRALVLYHMGIAYDGLRDPSKALDFYGQALALKERLGDRRQQAWIRGRMGDAHFMQREYDAALREYRRAVAIWQEIGDARGAATGLSNAARASLEFGDYETAIDLFRQATRLLGVSQPAFEATALAGIARAYAASGDEPRALEHARRAVERSHDAPDTARWATLRTLGGIERQFGNLGAALDHYLESVAVIESLRERLIPSSGVRADFLEGKQAVYSEAIEILIELGRVEQALEMAERSRTRAFLDLLAGRDVTTRPGDGAAPPFTTAQARREARKRNATVVEYFSTAERLIIWVIAPDGSIDARSSKVSRAKLTALVGAVRPRFDSTATRSQVEPPATHLLQALHRVLIEPIADLLPKEADGLVTIVPHGPLFLVSFAALLDANGRYFVERHTLNYSPSIGVLRYTQRNRDRVLDTGTPRLLIVGNPEMPLSPGTLEPLARLPGAEIEADAIRRLYSDPNVIALTGSQARERTVRELAPVRTIVHLATHAVVFDDEPLRSFLALAPDSPAKRAARDPDGDGLLTVAEAFGLDLHADLVTLSACNTGLGRISGEGVEGLSRAFIYAGAASVLVSLWPVADTVATTQMTEFYGRLSATRTTKAAALAAAQRHLIEALRDGKITSLSGRPLDETPLLWAPFVLVGEPR